MKVGGTWLGQNASLSEPSPVVDDVRSWSAHVYDLPAHERDRRHAARVHERREARQHARHRTYIPAMNPDGTPNPVIATTLKGQVYTGGLSSWMTVHHRLRAHSG